jgi:hypothetical protein
MDYELNKIFIDFKSSTHEEEYLKYMYDTREFIFDDIDDIIKVTLYLKGN